MRLAIAGASGQDPARLLDQCHARGPGAKLIEADGEVTTPSKSGSWRVGCCELEEERDRLQVVEAFLERVVDLPPRGRIDGRPALLQEPVDFGVREASVVVTAVARLEW